MADGTKIEWTDATWNVVNGCSVISPGCTNCYAMRLAGTRLKHHPSRAGLTLDSKAGPVWTGETRFNDKVLRDPLKWRRPRRIFVCAHGDLFHDSVPDAVIDHVFAVMALCPQHQFQVLTKRDQRMHDYLTALMAMNADDRDKRFEGPAFDVTQAPCVIGCLEDLDWPLPNVWLGVSVEDQARADERVPLLLDTPAAVRWVSAEPLLGPVNLQSIKAPRYPDEPADDLQIDWRFDALTTGDHYWFDGEDGQPGDCGDGPYREHRIDWVVAGGESGPGARPMHPDWARGLRDQCASATHCGDDAPVPFLFKQWGNWTPGENVARVTGWVPGAHWFDDQWLFEDQNLAADDGHVDDEPDLYAVGKKAAGRRLDGQLHDGFPA